MLMFEPYNELTNCQMLFPCNRSSRQVNDAGPTLLYVVILLSITVYNLYRKWV